MKFPHPRVPRSSLALSTILPLGLLTLPGLAVAQVVVNPPTAATVEGNSRISFPWGQGATDMRYQQICSLSTIPTATGLLKQIAHRRDNDAIVASGNYTAWNPALTLAVSTSPMPAAHMSPVFADNVGKDVKQVFSGSLKWPAQTKMPPGPTSFAYTIPFQSTFLYLSANGDITLDVQRLQSGANNNRLFFMDALAGSISSKPQQVTSLGAGCSNPTGKNTVLFYNNWIPGSNFARLLLYNAANNSPTFWSVGLNPQSPPLDLAVIGAPNCRLYHDNIVLVSGQTSNRPTPYTSRWEQRFRIPNDPRLAGASFYSQFVLMSDQHIGNAAQLSVSSGDKVVIGTWIKGEPAHTEAHASGLAPTMAGLVQHGYGMITEFTF